MWPSTCCASGRSWPQPSYFSSIRRTSSRLRPGEKRFNLIINIQYTIQIYAGLYFIIMHYFSKYANLEEHFVKEIYFLQASAHVCPGSWSYTQHKIFDKPMLFFKKFQLRKTAIRPSRPHQHCVRPGPDLHVELRHHGTFGRGDRSSIGRYHLPLHWTPREH